MVKSWPFLSIAHSFYTDLLRNTSHFNNTITLRTGIILGVSISIGFITICLCSMYCRRKCENARILRENAQSTKGRALARNGNRCCVDQSSTSVSQQTNTRVTPNEIELSVLCPSSPVTNNPHLDTKVRKGWCIIYARIQNLVEMCTFAGWKIQWNS